MSNAVICILNFPVFVNLPMHVPRESRLERAIEVAILAIDSLT